ncbi:hypothetical protein [Streptomyces sp. NPDC089915]|uniref:hypothetical protein n=1 Tax=Streptomyces sp. NPDC089915 TaxID=3155186 RepID=UPI00344AE99B
MSDRYEDFDSNAESALDGLLAQHQSSLLAVVAPALDLSSGLRQARSKQVRFSDDRTARDLDWVVATDQGGGAHRGRMPGESGALKAVLEEVRLETMRLRLLSRSVARHAAGCPLPPGVSLSPKLAAQMANRELTRIMRRLMYGDVTKRSAAREFAVAEKVLGEQAGGWAAVVDTAPPALLAEMDGERWLMEEFTLRYDNLLLLRERVVRLFEDAEEDAVQFS